MIIRNFAKTTNGLFARIIGKISALIILQYVNFINNKPIGTSKISDMDFGSFENTLDKNIDTDTASDTFDPHLQP